MLCVSCGKPFNVENRAMHPDVDLADVDTCSPGCDLTESLRLTAEHEGEGVPEHQTEAECIENGGWIQKKGKR